MNIFIQVDIDNITPGKSYKVIHRKTHNYDHSYSCDDLLYINDAGDVDSIPEVYTIEAPRDPVLRWVSVLERTPEKKDKYLFLFPSASGVMYPQLAYYLGNDEIVKDNGIICNLALASHWLEDEVSKCLISNK